MRPHPALIGFAREFNAGRYFEAHEHLEEALEELPEAEWDLYIGLIQVAVGYHKRSQGLRTGAAGMLRRGLEKLAAFPPVTAHLQVADLRRRVAAELEQLEDTSPRRQKAVPLEAPRIRFSKPPRPRKADS